MALYSETALYGDEEDEALRLDEVASLMSAQDPQELDAAEEATVSLQLGPWLDAKKPSKSNKNRLAVTLSAPTAPKR